MESTIHKLKNAKASGEDKVANEILKNGGQILMQAMTLLFQTCQSTTWTPEDWNKELLKPIHKKGKKILFDNKWGISLTSSIGKLFTRMLAHRLMLEAEYRGLLPEAQAGSRMGRSTMDNIFILDAMIQYARLRYTPLYLAL